VPRHPDFEKIFQAFLGQYCKDSPEKVCEAGSSRYYAWLKARGLDDTKAYSLPQESFQWAEPYVQLAREDKEARYYKVQALFPLSSMNNVVYTREELLQATRTLIGKQNDLNHTPKLFPEVEILDAQFEDDVAECLVRVPKDSELQKLIDDKKITQVSVEWGGRNVKPGPEGSVVEGLFFTGLGWLTNDVLPGVPLTTIQSVESIARKFKRTEQKLVCIHGKEQVEMCLWCGKNPVELWLGSCSACFDKLPLEMKAELVRAFSTHKVKEQVDPLVAGEYLLGFYQDPGLFLAEHFRVVWLDQPNGVLSVMSKPSADPASEKVQAIFFGKAKFDANSVRDWLQLHPGYLSPAGVSTSSNAQIEMVSMNEQKPKTEAEWTSEYINNLADDCFAVIDEGGKKDEQDKTTPRDLRHLPFKDENGNIDHDHLVNALARVKQDATMPEGGKRAATAKLCGAVSEWNGAHTDNPIQSDVCGTQEDVLAGKLAAAEKKLGETEAALKVEADAKVLAVSKWAAAEKIVAEAGKQGYGIVKDGKVMPVSEVVTILEALIPGPMVERSTMGMLRECQAIRAAIYRLKERLKAT
jgi:hypothetical protein